MLAANLGALSKEYVTIANLRSVWNEEQTMGPKTIFAAGFEFDCHRLNVKPL